MRIWTREVRGVVLYRSLEGFQSKMFFKLPVGTDTVNNEKGFHIREESQRLPSLSTLPQLFVCHLLQRRQWHPTPVLLPGKSHGRRSLVGCSPWGHWGSDTTERLHFHFSLPCIGEGNGSPHWCSCLENPRDGGGWWAAVYGVSQSRTQLNWLSSRHSRLGARPSIYYQ